MASGGKAVAENVSYLQNLMFFSVFFWQHFKIQISAVCCASYSAVAAIRIELSGGKVFDKKKKKTTTTKKKNKEKKHEKTICDFATCRFRTLGTCSVGAHHFLCSMWFWQFIPVPLLIRIDG